MHFLYLCFFFARIYLAISIMVSFFSCLQLEVSGSVISKSLVLSMYLHLFFASDFKDVSNYELPFFVFGRKTAALFYLYCFFHTREVLKGGGNRKRLRFPAAL